MIMLQSGETVTMARAGPGASSRSEARGPSSVAFLGALAKLGMEQLVLELVSTWDAGAAEKAVSPCFFFFL